MSTETPEKPPALTTVQILKLLIGILVFGVLMGWRTDFEQPWQRSVVAGCAAAVLGWAILQARSRKGG